MSNRYDIEAVSYDSANAWLKGQFFVGNYVAEARGISLYPKQVVFVNHIGPDKTAALKRIRDLGDMGCDEIVAHVASPTMRTNLENRGMTVSWTETITWKGKQHTAWRMYGDKTAFSNWLAKLDHGVLEGL